MSTASDIPEAERRLAAFLDGLGIRPARHAHPPLRTVEESRALRGAIPGVHVKNMFLTDRDGALVLVTCREDRRLRIGDLARQIGTRRLSFASPALLARHLGVAPGAVTPLAVVNDPARAVRVVLDAQMMQAELIACHPLHNEATVVLTPAELMRVFAAIGHRPQMVDFDALAAQAAAAALAPGTAASK